MLDEQRRCGKSPFVQINEMALKGAVIGRLWMAEHRPVLNEGSSRFETAKWSRDDMRRSWARFMGHNSLEDEGAAFLRSVENHKPKTRRHAPQHFTIHFTARLHLRQADAARTRTEVRCSRHEAC
jgi:hypothetical protein